MNTTAEAISILREHYRNILEQLASEYHTADAASSELLPIEEWLDSQAEVWGNRLFNLIRSSTSKFRHEPERLAEHWIGIAVAALKGEGFLDKKKGE